MPSKANRTAKGSKPKGRPAGSKTEGIVADEIKSACPRCNSTRREPYANTTTVASSGPNHTHVVFRTTRCRACGQARRDRTLENRK